jgi:CMP-N,N'-diacetyllegionaminic acid synthase
VPSAVAFVPARAGSQRVPRKNVLPLRGHPLIAYAIGAARGAGAFDAVVASTDDEEVAAIARHYGAEVLSLRPAEMSTATSPDIEWVRHTLAELAAGGREYELFSIVRPTSPFRTADTIGRAWDALLAVEGADSIRAVELCRQHPGKMWVVEGETMRPLLPQGEGVPYHSTRYQALPRVYVQNSSLEIAWTRVALEHGSIAGERVVPFLTEPAEGFSIDYPGDFERAERMVEAGSAELPPVTTPAYELQAAR